MSCYATVAHIFNLEAIFYACILFYVYANSNFTICHRNLKNYMEMHLSAIHVHVGY